jgi:hypothetical protein
MSMVLNENGFEWFRKDSSCRADSKLNFVDEMKSIVNIGIRLVCRDIFRNLVHGILLLVKIIPHATANVEYLIVATIIL